MLGTQQQTPPAPPTRKPRTSRPAWRFRTHAEPNYQVRSDNHYVTGRRGFYAYRDGRVVPTIYSESECEAHRQALMLYLGLLAGEGAPGSDVPF